MGEQTVRRFVLAHLRAVVAEYAVVVGTLVDGFVRSSRELTSGGLWIAHCESGSLLRALPMFAPLAPVPLELLELDRVDFLVAVTGSDTSHAAAWGVVRALRLETDLPPAATPALDGT